MPLIGSPVVLKSGRTAPLATPAPRPASAPSSAPASAGGGAAPVEGSSPGGAGSGLLRWPISQRRIAPATDLAATNTAYRFALSGNPVAWAAIVDAAFAGDLEVSQDGNGEWYPIAPGSVWAVPLRGKRRVIWLRKRSAGAGLLVIAGYASAADATASGKMAGGQAPSATATSGSVISVSPTYGTVSRDPIVEAGATNGTAIALAATTKAITILNRGAGELYIGETAAKATTAKGLLVPAGQSRDFKQSGGSLYYATDATGCTFDVQETTEA